MNAERSLNVARALREGKPEDFDMHDYVNYCGTPACALGHFASRGDLQAFLKIYRGPESQTPYLVYADTGAAAFHDADEVYEYFDIDEDESDELFNSHGCGNAQTNIQAAEYIEDFVARGSE